MANNCLSHKLMIIAGIDYGLNVGLAIATFSGDTLRRVLLETYYDGDQEVADLVIQNRCELVAMEDPPYSELGGSANSFYRILEILKSKGYEVNSAPPFERNIVRYLPGIWKPVVHAIKPDMRAWGPKTVHEKDAMGILWYAVLTIMGRAVRYV